MEQDKSPAIVKYISHIKQLQASSRSLDDIAKGLASEPALLREVAMELGHRVRPSDYLIAPCVYDIDMDETIILSGCSEHLHIDAYVKDFQIFAYVDYYTDDSISLELVFEKLSEIGLKFDNQHSREEQGYNHERRLIFAPSKWPIIAADMLFTLYRSDGNDLTTLNQLLDDHYPNINKKLLRDILHSGLVENESELCDWLFMNNKDVSQTFTVDVPNAF